MIEWILTVLIIALGASFWAMALGGYVLAVVIGWRSRHEAHTYWKPGEIPSVSGGRRRK